MKKLTLPIVFSLIFFVNTAVSPAPEEDAIPIEKIVVTASRREEGYSDTARRIEIITSEELEAAQAVDLSDVLSYNDAIAVNSYGGPGAVKTLRMRGSTAPQVMILVDGRPINDPRDGQVDLSTIPLENIERVEIMRGPASSLYGSSAMGGVIQILTKEPPALGQETKVSSSFGTFRTYQERLSHGQKIGAFGYVFTGDFVSSEGIRDNSTLNAKDFSLKCTYDIAEKHHVSIQTGFYTGTTGAPGSTIAPDPDDKLKTRKNFIDATWRFTLDPDTQLSAKVYNNYTRLEFLENGTGSLFDFPFIPFKKDVHTTQSRGLDIQADKRFNRYFRMVAGFNAVDNFNNSSTSAKHDYEVRAGYMENEFAVSEKLRMDIGVRLDNYSNFGFQANPSLSASYGLNEKIKLRGLIGRSFRAPTFNDLYWPNDGWSEGNPNLQPETGTTGEIGLTASIHQRLQTDLTYFRSRYRKLIQWAPVSSDPFALWTPTNIGSALIQGVELNNEFSPADNWTITVGYTFQLAKNDVTDKFLIYQPEHKVSFSIERRDISGWTIGTKGAWTGLRYNDAANTAKVKGFFILGFYASKKWKSGLTCYINIDNALNKSYETVLNYPQPGFDLTSGIKFEF